MHVNITHWGILHECNNLLTTGESSKSVEEEAVDQDEDENGKCTFNNSNLN